MKKAKAREETVEGTVEETVEEAREGAKGVLTISEHQVLHAHIMYTYLHSLR